MNVYIQILTCLALAISSSAQNCGNLHSRLKACNCVDKVGYIYSPEDIGSRDCHWQIYTEKKNQVVVVESLFIELDSNGSCFSDYLEFFDGPTRGSNSLGRWCQGPLTVESTGSEMLVTYRTDDVMEATPNSFKLTYKAKRVQEWTVGLILAIVLPLVCVSLFVVILMVIVCCCCSTKGDGKSSGRGFSGFGGVGGGFGGGGGGGCGGGGGGGGGGCGGGGC